MKMFALHIYGIEGAFLNIYVKKQLFVKRFVGNMKYEQSSVWIKCDKILVEYADIHQNIYCRNWAHILINEKCQQNIPSLFWTEISQG